MILFAEIFDLSRWQKQYPFMYREKVFFLLSLITFTNANLTICQNLVTLTRPCVCMYVWRFRRAMAGHFDSTLYLLTFVTTWFVRKCPSGWPDGFVKNTTKMYILKPFLSKLHSHWKKLPKNLGYFCKFHSMAQRKHLTMGENSPNLVTLMPFVPVSIK
jgi:hypothetical protein